jgi:CubicO group peptidase (beta-lactamase class C family)
VGRHVKDLPPSLAERPVAALLSHTSGVPDYEGLPGFDADRAISRETFTKAVGQMPSDFAPGEAWAYSNSGYVLLGYLIADVTGGTYHQAVETRLLGGLQDARFDDATALIPGRAEPYVADGEALRHATQMDGDYSSWPDGGLLMSARDAVRWEAGLQAGAPIPPADFRAMTTPVRLATGRSAGYGFGWFTDRAHGRDLHYHSGSVPGFLSFYWRTPAERLGVLVMLNLESGGAAVAMRQIAQELAEAAAPGTTLLSLRPIGDGEAALTGQALSMVTRGGTPLDATLFAPEIVALLPRMAGRVGPPNRTALGAPASFELVEAFDEPGGHVRRYRAAFADRTEHYAFAHAADGRIFRVRTV